MTVQVAKVKSKQKLTVDFIPVKLLFPIGELLNPPEPELHGKKVNPTVMLVIAAYSGITRTISSSKINYW